MTLMYPATCVCSHPESMHRNDQKRRRCSVYETFGGVWRACWCKAFSPAPSPEGT